VRLRQFARTETLGDTVEAYVRRVARAAASVPRELLIARRAGRRG